MKRVFVTGGAGFIGSAFVRLLLNERPQMRVLNFDALTYAGNLDNLRSLATDPRYARKLALLIRRYRLTRFDAAPAPPLKSELSKLKSASASRKENLP